jgi:sulfoxide reductase heme-binding subunit YedZ
LSAALAATGNAKAFWYLTRGTGTVALLLLTLSILLGVTTSTRWRSLRLPRFLISGLHRNVTLLALVFVVVHVLTTIADGYAPIGLVDAILPFHSAYRPVWLGLGAVAFDLLLALIVTSLLRARIGFKSWRAVHWLAYASWPVALVHALGTGSDARTPWLQLLAVLCTGTVVAAVLWRVATARSGAGLVRAAAVFGAFAVPLGVFVWAQSGPWQHGWSARAGTPTRLLASARAPVVRGSLTSAKASAATVPAGSFTGTLVGRLSQSQSSDGYVVVTIDATVRGGFVGRLHLVIRGAPLDGGGVQMVDSVVGLLPEGAPAWSSGTVTSLAGTRIAAAVRTSDGRTVPLTITLKLDQLSNGVTGSLVGGSLATSSSSEETDSG